MASSVDKVSEYFISLIVGVILLYVLWEVVKAVTADIPQLYKYGIAIAIAAGVALLAYTRGGLSR